MKDCIFCKFASGEIEKDFLYEDGVVMAFSDINPMSPTHILIVPKEHIEDFFHAPDKIHLAVSHAIKKLIDKEMLMGRGYRITVNGGGAQDINHLHFHLRGPIVRGEHL